MNRLAHPLIVAEMKRRAAQIGGVVFAEVPLVAERSELFDKIWFVTAPLKDRIERIMRRDNIPEALALKMIEAQKGEEKITADEIIENNGDKEDLIKKIRKLSAVSCKL